MSNLKVFESTKFGTILSASNEPLFCLSDVCKSLCLTSGKVSQRLCEETLSKCSVQTNAGKRKINFVNKDGLSEVVSLSNKPYANDLLKWVTSEILPEFENINLSPTSSENDDEIIAKAVLY